MALNQSAKAPQIVGTRRQRRASRKRSQAAQGSSPTNTGHKRQRVTARKPKRCKCCGEAIPLGKQRSAIYCGDACKSAAWRKRHAPKRRAKQRSAPVADPMRCPHCHEPFWADNPRTIWCSDTCKTAASKARRKATIEAYAVVFGLDLEHVDDTVERSGSRGLSWLLEQEGFVYRAELRQWVQPVTSVQVQVA